MFFQPRFRLFFFPLFVLGLPSLHSLAESTMCTESEDSRLIRSTEPLTSLRFQFLAFRSIRQQQPANLRTRQKRPYAPFPLFQSSRLGLSPALPRRRTRCYPLARYFRGNRYERSCAPITIPSWLLDTFATSSRTSGTNSWKMNRN